MDDEMEPETTAMADVAAAERLMAKLRAFIRTELDDRERAMFASLLAPGVAEAHDEREVDVVGFGTPDGGPVSLPEHLAHAVRGSGIRIVIEPA